MRAISLAAALLVAVGNLRAQEQACTAAPYGQLDFWIGHWDVFDTRSGAPAGASHIDKIYGGCVVRENWTEPGFAGGSLNIYSRVDRQWHQTWVDSSGATREFSGGLQGTRVVLVAHAFAHENPTKPTLVRLALSANRDGSVHQYSDYSTDGGRSWKFRYDYTYRRRK